MIFTGWNWNVILPFIFTDQIQMSCYHWYSRTLCAQESKSDNSFSGTSMRSGRSSGILISICSSSGGTSTWSDGGDGVAGLGNWQINRCFWPLGTGSSDHNRWSRSAVGSYSSSSESTSVGGVSSNIRHCQIPWWKGSSSLGHLGVKEEMGHCGPLESMGLKETSVVQTKKTCIGLITWVGSP